MEDVRQLFTQLFAWAPGTGVEAWWVLFLAAFGLGHLASFLWNYNGDLLLRLGWPGRIACVTVTVLAIILFGASGRSFIYFQF
jgi:hypothetical protein